MQKRFNFNIVGEYSYQENIYIVDGKLSYDGKAKAVLIPEKNNPHDINAVKVEIFGLRVGYLAREDAVIYRQALGAKKGQCLAVLQGGYDDYYYGVRLNLQWPPCFKQA